MKEESTWPSWFTLEASRWFMMIIVAQALVMHLRKSASWSMEQYMKYKSNVLISATNEPTELQKVIPATTKPDELQNVSSATTEQTELQNAIPGTTEPDELQNVSSTTTEPTELQIAGKYWSCAVCQVRATGKANRKKTS